jgi:2-amino-4-hydroxy-6-hydroxymethyldihydropteridine diphosphokinase
LKRIRAERWGPRSIDIDILTYDGLTIRQPSLEIPHPRMMDRAFVMTPLAEIAPDLVVRGVAVKERLASLDTAGIVRESEDSSWWQA